MRKIFIMFFVLAAVVVKGEIHNNPFLSYIRQIEFLEKQLSESPENQKAGIEKRLEDIRKQMARAVAQRKKPYLRRLRDLEKYLAESKSESKKKSLQERINRTKSELARLDAYAGGASKYDIEKAEIDDLKKKEEEQIEEKDREKSKTVVD